MDRRSFHWVLREVDVGGHYGCVTVERHFLLKRLSRLFKEMRGVSEAAEALLARYLRKPEQTDRYLSRRNCTVVDGFYVDTETGIVCGQYLDLDANNGSAAPIYYYNRSWRFVALFNNYNISLPNQTVALDYFEALEKVWEKEKKNYTRVYFLTQKVILQEICKRLSIPSTQPPKRPISDVRRYNAQIKIFNALWNILIVDKYESTTRRRPTVLRPICAG